MIDIRLVASDVDGTMLPANGAISENLRLAIARCLDRGIPFILSSGRWIGALGRIIESCGVGGQPMIIANGAAVLGPDGVPLREWTLCESDARLAFDVMRRYDVQINSYVRNGLYCLNTRVLARQATMIRDYIGTGHARLSLDDPAAFEAFALTAPYKLEAMTEDPELIREVRAALRDTGLAVTHSSSRNVELMAPGVGKGQALKWLAGRMGVPLEHCMAFGDNANDLDMLSVVGWPVAVGNAEDAVKAAARIVGPADVDDGVARVLIDQVLGEESA